MRIEQFFLDGLGHQSYCISDTGSGVAAIVDPRRDIEIYLDTANRAGVAITHILETHVHNDYVSGARELAARTGATIVASADARLAYEHQPVRDGDQLAVGDLRVGVLATPGHTPEHVSYLLFEPGREQPHAVFSGGSMLAGGAGRTDLLGPTLTLTLTRQQYQSLRRMLETLPDATLVYPTHGAGSFCVASASSGSEARHTTIAQERLASPAVNAEEDEFVRRQIAGYTAYPRYYAHMHDINQVGPRILGGVPEPPALAPHLVQAHISDGVPLVDGRMRGAFARDHVPGSLHIELDASFGTYAGWILPFNSPLMLVVEDALGRQEAVVQLLRIGYEQVEGYLDGGVAAWRAAGLPTRHFERIGIEQLHERWAGSEPPLVLDVRRDDEWREGHIPGARHIYVADLPARLDEVPSDRPIAVICAAGYRASMAASVLDGAGRHVIAVQGGVPDWRDKGLPITTANS